MILASAILLVISLGSQVQALPWLGPAEPDQSSPTREDSTQPSTYPEGEQDPDSGDPEDTDEGEEAAQRSTKSGYDNIPKGSSPTSVEADLQADDELKFPLFRLLRRTLEPLYRFKDRVNGIWGIAFGVDYNFLNQHASFSFTDDQATSGACRGYGTWDIVHAKEKIDGILVFRGENRHSICGVVTPRDLGFDGDALHVPRDAVAETDPEIRGQILFDGYLGNRSRPGGGVTPPRARDELFGAHHRVPIGVAVLAPQGPAWHPGAHRIGQELLERPPVDAAHAGRDQRCERQR